jgi:hypothetical protein
MDDELTMLIGPGRDGMMLEIDVLGLEGDDSVVIPRGFPPGCQAAIHREGELLTALRVTTVETFVLAAATSCIREGGGGGLAAPSKSEAKAQEPSDSTDPVSRVQQIVSSPSTFRAGWRKTVVVGLNLATFRAGWA